MFAYLPQTEGERTCKGTDAHALPLYLCFILTLFTQAPPACLISADTASIGQKTYVPLPMESEKAAQNPRTHS